MAVKQDKHAVIWSRTAAGPIKMADLIVTAEQTRYSYTREYVDTNLAGVSLLAPVASFGTEPVIYYAKDLLPLYPRLASMIPAHGVHNIQRRIYTRILQQRDNVPAPGLDTDWEILLLAGHNGIGHLDIFRDDRVAEDYYGHSDETRRVGSRSGFWNMLKSDIQNNVYDLEQHDLAELLGPTPSVGGMIPKILAAIPDSEYWNGQFATPGTNQLDNQAYTDVILKIEPPEYEGVVELEALCLELHKQAGFEVPRFWKTEVDGMRLLAVERFDRTAEGYPIPLESFFSVFAIGDRHFQQNADTDLAEVANRLYRLGRIMNLDVRATQRELFRRIMLAFFTGNGDMHLENLSFLGGNDDVRLAPVYDPAPMRAWSRHNTRFAIPVIFDKSVGGLRENIIQLGSGFGYSRHDVGEVIQQTADLSIDFIDKVQNLQKVPQRNRRFLADILLKERKLMLV